MAFVFKDNGEPKWTDLGQAAPIDRAVAALRSALRDREANVRAKARVVDALVMQPIRKFIGKSRHVLISPDGALNLVPFAALVDERGECLVNRYLITYLASGRDLLRLQERAGASGSPLILADPDFGEVDTSPGSNPSQGMGEFDFERLAATAEEASEVQSMLTGALALTGRDATEGALKAASGPLILHVATHGFFFDNSTWVDAVRDGTTRIVRIKRASKQADRKRNQASLINPLLRSGLLLAGARLGKDKDGNDGVLTALEASGLDLWGTKLVVLSACDTGVGEVQNGEGVYGLRRALVLAGSESQMMSLWPVSDRGTRDLMINYYLKLKAGAGRSGALRQAQLEMLKDPNKKHPFYWASFIQSGEWANLDGKR